MVRRSAPDSSRWVAKQCLRVCGWTRLPYRTTYVDPNAPPAAAGRGPSAAGPQAGQNVREMAGADGQQAVRLLRQRATEFGVLSNRIGFIGYSAGGAVLLSTVYGPRDGRPDFAAPVYAAGANSNPPPEGAPPLFIAVAADDQTVGYRGRLTCLARGEKRGCLPSCTYFRPASTASERRAAARTTTWTALRSG